MILPLVRSYGLISTITLSPGRILMKFILIFPDTWVSTEWFWFFTRLTRNMAFGRDSFTIASTRIGSSFGITLQKMGPFGRDTIGIDPTHVNRVNAEEWPAAGI